MTTTSSRQLALGSVFGLTAAILIVSGCDDKPATALVENGYPAAANGEALADTITVFKTWWVTTLFPSPVVAGGSSETERTIPASDFAYALLAPGWSPDSVTPPPRLVAVKSLHKLAASAHDTLTITVSDDQFAGNCPAGAMLTDDDAHLIVERIFPGQFVGMSYDPATCTSLPTRSDGSVPDDAADSADAASASDTADD
jgi:hypothetical protein